MGAREDVDSVEDLIAQSRAAASEAISNGNLTEEDWNSVNTRFEEVEVLHDDWRAQDGSPDASSLLAEAGDQLEVACKCLDPTIPDDESAAACGSPGSGGGGGGCTVSQGQMPQTAGWIAIVLIGIALRRPRKATP